MQTKLSDKLYFYMSATVLNVCIIALLWSIGPFTFLKPATTVAASIDPVLYPAHQVLRGKPTRIVIPSIHLDLPVIDGTYSQATGTWAIGNHKAYYATPTPAINDFRGTTLIYGHNNRTAFRWLRDMQAGAELTVYTDSGSTFHYVLSETKEVSPSDVTILSMGGRPKVALQTCSGNWNEWRKLFMFELRSVDKAPSHV